MRSIRKVMVWTTLGGPNHRWQDLYALDVDIEEIDPASANRVSYEWQF
ncbi:MAG: hypothetical protein U5L96_15580 [Owenweeksia sp.]|nr:hypothetical protein [Owenweeksia sp.]